VVAAAAGHPPPMAENHGVSTTELTDDELRRELEHLHATRHEALLGASESAFETHTERMLALEQEFIRRFPREAAPDPERTRAGARSRADQRRPV
jgi:uncharacterized protein DUF6158